MGAIKFPHASGNSMSIGAPATNPASDLELKLPATIGTAGQVLKNSSTPGTLEFGAGGGITEADYWYVTQDYSAGDVTPLDANISRMTTGPTSAPLGTGMSKSSGIWTFPSTGWWEVTVHITFQIPANTASNYCYVQTQGTTNNSAYSTLAEGYAHASEINSTHYSGADSTLLLDITDTANQKIKFNVDVENNNVIVSGHSTVALTYFRFIKLAAT